MALRKEVEEGREAMGTSLRFHSEQYKATAHKSAAERELDDIQEEARGVYDEFNSVAAEVDQILNDVITYLTVTIRNQNVPWQSSAAVGHNAASALQMNAAKIRAIEEHLGVYADGTPVRLSVLDMLRYGTARAKLEAKIEKAREMEGDILGMLDELGENELLSRDEALTQFFVLEQFSIFKQYALRSQLFTFSVTTALPVDPLSWILGWAFMICSLLFFIYWTLMWGVSTSASTVESWGINFALSTCQDLFLVQVFRLYVIYMISTITIKPQLTAIYNTLQRLAIEYVQDELPDAFGVIRVVQHVSPACRVAKLKISDSLAAGQILRHIDDRDISNFRVASSLKLPLMFFMVVAIPVIIGLVNEAAGDIMLDTVLPSAFSMLIVAHYFLWMISPLLVIVPYALIIAVIVMRGYIFDQASRRVQQMRTRLQGRKELRAVAGWHVRSGLAFHPDESFLQSAQRYLGDLPMRYQTWWLDAAAVVTHYLCRWMEIPGAVHRLLFTSPAKDSLILQWRNINMPANLQGLVARERDILQAQEKCAIRGSAPNFPAEIQALVKNVRDYWDLEADDTGSTTLFSDGSSVGYLPSVLSLSTPKAAPKLEEAEVEFGTVLSVGWQSYNRVPINSPLARAFREKFDYCATSKRALTRVISSYREQMLAGRQIAQCVFDAYLTC